MVDFIVYLDSSIPESATCIISCGLVYPLLSGMHSSLQKLFRFTRTIPETVTRFLWPHFPSTACAARQLGRRTAPRVKSKKFVCFLPKSCCLMCFVVVVITIIVVAATGVGVGVARSRSRSSRSSSSSRRSSRSRSSSGGSSSSSSSSCCCCCF